MAGQRLGGAVLRAGGVQQQELGHAVEGGLGLGLHLAAHAPDIVIITPGQKEHEGRSVWGIRLRDLAGTATAVITAEAGQDTRIRESGERPLWADLTHAYMDWLRAGRPSCAAPTG
ncbi:hypothetical protein GCM10020220_032880 [Nonomuraea rubra]